MERKENVDYAMNAVSIATINGPIVARKLVHSNNLGSSLVFTNRLTNIVRVLFPSVMFAIPAID